MKKASYYSDHNYPIGKVDYKLYSSFIEHLGRAVYTGIYEPGHPKADSNGFREDVIEAIQELKVPMVRYPGGNFVSCYNWKDGIGPKKGRPVRMELTWTSIETNQFGIDEFCRWAKKAGIEPMIAVNLGTGTIQEAGELVEYCNHPGGTYWSDTRIKNGSKEPYNIKYWCLGNEMEGELWQAGQLKAADYAKKAKEAAKIMRWVDPSIKLVASGSSYEMLTPEYLEWDRILMLEVYDYVDYLSIHYYSNRIGQDNITNFLSSLFETYDYGRMDYPSTHSPSNGQDNITNFLASYKQLNDKIKKSVHVLDYVKSKLNKKKEIPICLDEWNVWSYPDDIIFLNGAYSFKSKTVGRWEEAPPILEERYSLLDALVLGGLLITLLNNSDRVEIACLAQLVNAIAPIVTAKDGGVLKQSIYYPFKMVSNYGRGIAMQGVVEAPEYESYYGVLPIVEPAMVYNEETGELRLFVLNCNQQEDTEIDIQLNGYGKHKHKVVNHYVLNGDDLEIQNTFDNPDNVTMKEIDTPSSGTTVVLPKMSWSVIILK